MSGIRHLPEDDEQPVSKPLTLHDIRSATVGADLLQKIQIPIRELICGAWFKQGELGFIFGVRGLGKTMLGLDLAVHLVKAEDLAMWKINKARKVLYIDGEMPLDDIRSRLEGLDGLHPNLTVLNHELLFTKTVTALNIADRSHQKAITEHCLALNTNVLILDNLSCLAMGMKENEADDWEQILPWLLNLRRQGITDGSRRNAQARRLDCEPWSFGGKSRSFKNSQGAWPIGAADMNDAKVVMFCEGGPDFLAALYVAGWEGLGARINEIAVCCMTGAGNVISPEALPLFAGKRVRINIDDDQAGEAAFKRWGIPLRKAGAIVDGFSFNGLLRADGVTPCNDLADFAQLFDAGEAPEGKATEGLFPS